MNLAVLCDLLEERWYSMDLLGDMLLEHAPRLPNLTLERVRPPLFAPLARIADARGEKPLERWGYRAGLGLGRLVQYPLAMLAERSRHDFFHLVDHSYGHVLYGLPARRTGIFCHDLDAFRPAFDPSPQSLPHRALAQALLLALKRARVVFHSSLTVREQILERGLIPAERLVHAPYGVAAEFQPEPRSEDRALAGLPPFVMHVGSLIPRKNPEALLELIVELCRARPELHVYQMGGTWTEAQRARLVETGIAERVHQFAHLGRPELSAYLRATRAVLLPSLAEGFGLPVVEALGCGAPVVVNRIPVLTEVGGDGVVALPVSDLGAFRDAVLRVVDGGGPSREARLRAAERYTWPAHARTIVETYLELGRSG
jgi:glycosyltransferase involved in cell wall biosynthesis